MSTTALRSAVAPACAERPRLLEQVRRALRVRRYSQRTEDAYVGWIRRFVRFHRMRHPAQLGPDEIGAFLTRLATDDKVAAATQTQALCALLFLYRTVLRRPAEAFVGVVRARKPERVPGVLSRGEVRRLLGALEGDARLVCLLLYGGGLRLNECLEGGLGRHHRACHDTRASHLGPICSRCAAASVRAASVSAHR
jgi:integrase